MSNLGEPRLHRVSGVIEGLSLMGTKTAEQVAPHVRIAPRSAPRAERGTDPTPLQDRWRGTPLQTSEH